MREHIIERTYRAAFYTIKNNSTVRQTAKALKVSKSTVHKDLRERLERVNPTLHTQVVVVLERNLLERHMRGGLATRKMYKEARKFDIS